MNSTKGVVHVCLKRGASSIMHAEHALVTPLPLKKSRFSRERLFSILFVSWNSRVFQFV